ncbi:MAG: protein-disulfide reductase DsbD domain-containing protein [Gemmobacter sp.]
MTMHPFRLAVMACALSLAALPVRAGGLADIFSADLLPGWRTDSGSHMAALRLRLADGWKTYWRAPGDAGIAPEFDWGGSDNIRAVRFHWPRPSVFLSNGMQSIGYAQELILPIEIWPDEPDAPIAVQAQVDLGVCRDICVPATVAVAASLPAARGAADPAIRAALKNRPLTAREAGVGRVACTVAPLSDGVRLTAEIDLPPLGPGETAVIETASRAIWVSEATTRRSGARLVAEADLVAPGRKPFALDRSGITITLLSDRRAVEVAGCPGG